MKSFATQVLYTIPSARVREIETDPEFAIFLAERFARKLNAEVTSYSSTTEGTSTKVSAALSIPADALPGPARAFASNGLVVTIEETWNENSGALVIHGGPAKLDADFQLTDSGSGSMRRYKGQLSIGIPLMGASLEKKAIGYADTVVAIQRDAVEDYGKRNENV